MKINANLIKNAVAVILISSPLFVLAAGGGANFQGLIGAFTDVLKLIIPFFMLLATVIFLWGVITYLTAGGEEEKIKSGRTYMLWGIISLFVMIAVWGLVNVLEGTFAGVILSKNIPTGPQ